MATSFIRLVFLTYFLNDKYSVQTCYGKVVANFFLYHFAVTCQQQLSLDKLIFKKNSKNQLLLKKKKRRMKKKLKKQKRRLFLYAIGTISQRDGSIKSLFCHMTHPKTTRSGLPEQVRRPNTRCSCRGPLAKKCVTLLRTDRRRDTPFSRDAFLPHLTMFQNILEYSRLVHCLEYSYLSF